MNTILVIGAIVIFLLLIGFLLKVMRAAITMAIGIALIVLVLRFVFGIAPQEMWGELVRVWENMMRAIGLS